MTEPEENSKEGTTPPEPKGDDVRTMIREELKALLPEFTASLPKVGEPAKEEENESATSKMIERSAKKAVEEAMSELRKLLPKTPPAPKKDSEGETEKPKIETIKEKESAPEDTGKKKFNLQKLIWGE